MISGGLTGKRIALRMNDISGLEKPEPESSSNKNNTQLEDIFDLLISDFKKKNHGFVFKEDKFISIGESNIRIVLPEAGFSSFFFRPFVHLGKDSGDETSLSILCFKAGSDYLKSIQQILPGYTEKKNRDVPFFTRRGITMSVGRESNTVSLLNKDKGVAFFLFDDISNLPYYESGSPFKNILQWWFENRDSSMIHSASIAFDGMALLIAGRGGSGKSSTALSCIMNGMEYLGDDYIVVNGEKKFSVSSVYNSIKLTSDSLKKFSGINKNIINPSFTKNEKGVAFLSEIKKFAMARSASLKGVILPEISGFDHSSFSRISSSECFRSLAPSTIFQHIGRRKNISKFIAQLTKHLPCYKLKAGRDPELISEIVKSIFKE